MADYTNSGALFRNVNKKSARHPDFGGSLENVQCPHCHAEVNYWLSGWINVGKTSGRRFFSLSVKPKEAERDPNRAGLADPGLEQNDFDDEIPF